MANKFEAVLPGQGLTGAPTFNAASTDDAWQVVRRYHEETKLDVESLIRDQAGLDWGMQPNPFRRYKGAPLLRLPVMTADDTPLYYQIYESGSIPSRSVTLESVGQLLELSLGLSGWKEVHGQRWPLRVNPSSGNLHPTECYLLIDQLHKKKSANYCAGQPMVCHYAPAEHALEIRAHVARNTWQALISTLPPSSFLIGLTSIYWREAWKYGARAYRYCQHDVGHALAALRFSAAVLGWRLVLLESIGDKELAELLGIGEQARIAATERELPVLLAAVIPIQEETDIRPDLHTGALRETATIWRGQANKISARHVKWEIIEQVADACAKPNTPLFKSDSIAPPGHGIKEVPVSFHTVQPSPSAKRIICQRRSASSLDGITEISSSDFYSMLQLTLRRDSDGAPATHPPWDAIRGSARLHLCLFIHRVSGILPGLYILVREPCKLIELRSCMRTDFAWEIVPGCPSSLPLYFLHSGDYQRIARLISCGQTVAADAAFSLAMVAEFERPLHEFGAWYYRHLFWEAGMIGQVLYLEAEVRGLRSTGLGCFLDDAVHQVLGFSGWQYQSLYNFAVGAAIEDARLSQSPAYDCEQRKLRKGLAIY